MSDNKQLDPIAKKTHDREFLIKVISMNNKIMVISLVVATLMGIALIYKIAITENKYFTVSSKGQIVRLIPLNRAMVSNASARNFAGEVSTLIYSLNYVDLKKQLTHLESLFSKQGFEDLLIALKPVLKSIKKNNLYAHASYFNVPVLLEKAELSGVMHWKFNLKLQVFYEGVGGVKHRQNLVVTIKLRRTDNRVNERGVEAYSFIAQDEKAI